MIKADTVHSFQGEEKDIMILSLVVTSNSPVHKANWINNMVSLPNQCRGHKSEKHFVYCWKCQLLHANAV